MGTGRKDMGQGSNGGMGRKGEKRGGDKEMVKGQETKKYWGRGTRRG